MHIEPHGVRLPVTVPFLRDSQLHADSDDALRGRGANNIIAMA